MTTKRNNNIVKHVQHIHGYFSKIIDGSSNHRFRNILLKLNPSRIWKRGGGLLRLKILLLIA